MEMAHSNGMRMRSEAPRRRLGASFWTLALRIPEVLCAATLALLIVFLVISVFSRYAMDLGLAWSDEFARLLFAWIVLVGFAIAVRHRANVGVDWLVRKLDRKGQLALAVVQDVLILAFSVFYTWEAWVTVEFSLIQRLPALDVTIAWLYGSSFAAGGLMVLYGIANLLDTLQGRLPPSHLDLPAESTRIE